MNIPSLIQQQRAFYYENATKSLSFRLKQLKRLKKVIEQNEKNIINALQQDLHKSEFESYSTEIGFLYAEVNKTIKELKEWMKPEKVKTPTSHIGSKSYIYKDPYGVSLIIAPWNYPFQLAIAPAIGAIAGGNTIVLKPSELTPNVSALIKQMIEETFDTSYFAVVEGGVEVSQELLDQPFDFIFFTGSVPVGKIVMEKAAQHLTPHVLELGGKSPVIVDETAKIELAAKRIAWGKFTNAGQTCIAPDYVYVHENVKQTFLTKLKEAVAALYGSNPIGNGDYTHIVNEKHFNRLTSYLTNGTLVSGGKSNQNNLVIEPTILENVDWNEPIMQDEIFGPILPVLSYSSIDDVINQVRSKPKPLALYFFSEDEKSHQKIIQQLSFGGGSINDTLFHIANPNLPFGGVGPSGIGSYHGKASFDAFTHEKSMLHQTTKYDISIRYPNTKFGLSLIKKVLK
ncbi:aldehyde dehydrogenase [Pontibacillus litoralis]|uniref:Aldehyde dehydrogenase n=1 Tax=Pontibacillus litoralis JSM 072002 TaxID=1385512 RepID=A0A0A5G3A7_9BACI|nr:aldehyde dehydrogenase [Pontibacillus litoralis JSM 072002]